MVCTENEFGHTCVMQEHAGHIEKMRRALESQVKELQVRLDEAEASAMKGGKRMIQKLEQRVNNVNICKQLKKVEVKMKGVRMRWSFLVFEQESCVI